MGNEGKSGGRPGRWVELVVEEIIEIRVQVAQMRHISKASPLTHLYQGPIWRRRYILLTLSLDCVGIGVFRDIIIIFLC